MLDAVPEFFNPNKHTGNRVFVKAANSLWADITDINGNAKYKAAEKILRICNSYDAFAKRRASQVNSEKDRKDKAKFVGAVQTIVLSLVASLPTSESLTGLEKIIAIDAALNSALIKTTGLSAFFTTNSVAKSVEKSLATIMALIQVETTNLRGYLCAQDRLQQFGFSDIDIYPDTSTGDAKAVNFKLNSPEDRVKFICVLKHCVDPKIVVDTRTDQIVTIFSYDAKKVFEKFGIDTSELRLAPYESLITRVASAIDPLQNPTAGVLCCCIGVCTP
jgi:hypothetical protein